MQFPAAVFLLFSFGIVSASSLVNPDANSVSSSAGPYGLDNAHCQQSFYQIGVNSTNVKFVGIDQTQPNQSMITSLILQFTTSQTNFTENHTNGTIAFSGMFNISGTVCTPVKGAKTTSAIQLLVHGIGSDSSYWDFAFAPEYSYVRHAASHGYTTFRYDRLGTGRSETPTNGFDVAQGSTEVAILTHILTLLRTTTTIGGRKWARVVGVGHSYGSIQTHAVSAAHPELYDAVVLQGFSADGSNAANYMQAAGYLVARDTLPGHLGTKPPAWLVTAAPATGQLAFWRYPFYAPGALALARSTEQAVTLGGLFTLSGLFRPAPAFDKPVQIVLADKDFIFATSNAYGGMNGLSIADDVHPILYPNSSAFESYIPANTGHAVNQHFSAPATYEKMLDFISRHNL